MLVFVFLPFGNAEFLQVGLYLVLALQFASLDGYHFIQDVLFGLFVLFLHFFQHFVEIQTILLDILFDSM